MTTLLILLHPFLVLYLLIQSHTPKKAAEKVIYREYYEKKIYSLVAGYGET